MASALASTWAWSKASRLTLGIRVRSSRSARRPGMSPATVVRRAEIWSSVSTSSVTSASLTGGSDRTSGVPRARSPPRGEDGPPRERSSRRCPNPSSRSRSLTRPPPDPSRGAGPASTSPAEQGWVNDPLTPTWDGRRYHLFFQYVPGSTDWAVGCHWGHAVSDDLLHWEERPVALAPDAQDDGVWSGSVVRRDDGYRIFYTSVSHDDLPMGRVRWADSPDLDGPWTKGDVVVWPPTELDVTAFRDPFVFREGDGWRMLVGTSLGGTEAAAAGYSSSDLSHWVFDGISASRTRSSQDPVWTGSLWECPSWSRSPTVASSSSRSGTPTGCTTWPPRRSGRPARPWSREQWQQLTVGTGYYAPATFTDAEGAPCLVFWLRGLLDQPAGRAGALSVPHRIEWRDGRLVLRLHPGVTSAARSSRGGSNAALAEPADVSVDPLRVGAGGRVALSVTHVRGRVVIDVDGTRDSIEAPATDIQVLLDGPCVEVVTLGGAFAHTLPGATRWDDRADGAALRWLP